MLAEKQARRMRKEQEMQERILEEERSRGLWVGLQAEISFVPFFPSKLRIEAKFT